MFSNQYELLTLTFNVNNAEETSNKHIIVAGRKPDYEKYKTMENAKEVYYFWRKALKLYKHQMSKGLQKIFECMRDLAKDIPGVVYAKIDFIAKKVGVSRSTVKRAIAQFKAWGLIKAYHTLREKNGSKQGNAHALYVLQPNSVENAVIEDQMTTDEVGQVEVAAHNGPAHEPAEIDLQENAPNPCHTNDFKGKNAEDISYLYKLSKELNNKTIVQEKQFSKLDMIGHWVPKEFAAYALNIFADPKEVEQAWKQVRSAVKHKLNTHDLKTFAITCVKGLFRALKFGKEPINEPLNYLYGIALKIHEEAAKQPNDVTNPPIIAPMAKPGGRTEYVPDWFYKRNEPKEVPTEETKIDYAAERAKILNGAGIATN